MRTSSSNCLLSIGDDVLASKFKLLLGSTSYATAGSISATGDKIRGRSPHPCTAQKKATLRVLHRRGEVTVLGIHPLFFLISKQDSAFPPHLPACLPSFFVRITTHPRACSTHGARVLPVRPSATSFALPAIDGQETSRRTPLVRGFHQKPGPGCGTVQTTHSICFGRSRSRGIKRYPRWTTTPDEVRERGSRSVSIQSISIVFGFGHGGKIAAKAVDLPSSVADVEAPRQKPCRVVRAVEPPAVHGEPEQGRLWRGFFVQRWSSLEPVNRKRGIIAPSL